MAFTKKKKEAFERIIQKGLLIMPKEFRKRTEVSLFEDEEMGSKDAEFKPMRFELCYIRIDENKTVTLCQNSLSDNRYREARMVMSLSLPISLLVRRMLS